MINFRNDAFDTAKKSPRVFTTEDIERISGNPKGSFFKNLSKALIPVNPLTKKPLLDFTPKVSEEFTQLVEKSKALSEIIDYMRFAEGLVFINGRRVPGIFDGFRVSGGTIVEKLDEKTREAVLEGVEETDASGNVTIVKKILPGLDSEELTFNIEKGIKPFSGDAKFIFLDDEYSTALEKACEFIRIMTYWQDGVDAKKEGGRIRLFRIESFLVGAGRPFNFSVIRITDFGIDMTKGTEGRLDGTFQFEQFATFKKEATYRKPDSSPNHNDSGNNIAELSIDENPVLGNMYVPKNE